MFDLFKKKRNIKELQNHQFFTTMNYWVNIEIDNLPIASKVKKNVITKFLKIKFSVFEKNVREYVSNLDDDSDTCLIFEQLIIDCIKQYEDEAVRSYIPQLFIDKFRKWHDGHTDITFNAITSICESKFYNSNYEKTAAILDILLFAFRLTIIDAERTIAELNGELEKILQGSIFDD